MKSKLSHLRPWFLPLLMIACAFSFQLSGKSGFDYLCYNREQIFSGQWWRLLTGHLLHISWTHLLMNIAGLVLLQILFLPMLSPLRWFMLVLISISGIDLGLIIFNPEVEWYVGLSGVLHGVIAAGSLLLIFRLGIKGSGILVLLSLKLIWEQFIGPIPGSEEWTGGAVITEAHLYGAISGGLFIILIRLNKGCINSH